MAQNFLDNLKEETEKAVAALAPSPRRWRRIKLVAIFIIIISFAAVGALSAYGAFFRGKVLPGVYIGDVPLAGLNRGELAVFLSDMNDKLANEGLRFRYSVDGRGDTLVVYPELGSDNTLIELVEFDVEKEVTRLIGDDHNILSFGVWALWSNFKKTDYKLETVSVDKERLLARIKSKLAVYETMPRDANVKIISVDPLQYEVTPSVGGVVYDYEKAVERVGSLWSELRPVRVDVPTINQSPLIFETDVKSIESRLPNVFASGPIELSYQDPHTGFKYDWQIGLNQIADWLEVQDASDDGFVFGLEKESVENFLAKKVVPSVNVEAQDAKFKIGDAGKVEEFQGSRPGIKIDLEKTYLAINDALVERTRHDEGVATAVAVVVERIEPKTKTGDVNDFGIREILGVGISNYSGSPKNRVKNIANAVKKLNGVLIKPGEVFSALQYTKPFTSEGGYLPEKVIKGDEIKPEVGGGLCQIGTTLFRMAMKAGMEIVERRNHSLVVSYYNDPVNGNPGTDATVYEPKPDFRFKNDTTNYVLVQTEMDIIKGELRFYLWGTSDGRKSSYSHPVVKRWIPYGESKEIETTKLEPGQKECQHTFKGADASFTYTREFSDGREKEETVFESHYRALPQICLVGVEEVTQEPADMLESDIIVSEADQSATTSSE